MRPTVLLFQTPSNVYVSDNTTDKSLCSGIPTSGKITFPQTAEWLRCSMLPLRHLLNVSVSLVIRNYRNP